MTPDERDRLAKVETKVDSIDAWMQSIAHDVADVKRAANMGRGIIWFVVSVGAVALMAWNAIVSFGDHFTHK